MNTRPKLNIPLSSFELAVQLVSLLGIVASFVLLLIVWPDIPDKVPTHFGSSGEADAWGGKSTLVWIPMIAVGLYALLTLIEQFPQSYNYLCEITEKNAEFQYRNARMMLECMKLELIYFFGYLEWKTVQVAIGQAEGLGPAFLFVFLIILFGTLGFFLYRMVRYAE